jgi:hypothetical protein
MHKAEVINFINKKIDITKYQKALNVIPRFWWEKCAAAIRLANKKNYRIEVNLDNLTRGNIHPGLNFKDDYQIFHETKEVKHNRSLTICF